MAWEQVKKFNPSKMGTRTGWCLMNCRLGFGINKGTNPSAKADIEFNKNKGAFHDMKSLPKNVAVPVYLDTYSENEHVMVCDKGTYYSDGRRLTSTKGLNFFGWGEYCDGVRVVKKVADKNPTTTTVKEGDRVKTTAYRDVYGTLINRKIINDGQSVWKKTDNHGRHAWLYKGNILRCIVKVYTLKKA